jgi:predicted ATPase
LIRTPDQRLRVFVSSTLDELAPERAAVRAAIERLRLIPVMFEMGARPYPPRALYRSYLKQSQVFIGLYWQRYGWVAPDEEISGLEDEYRLSKGMPRLLYMKQPAEREPRLKDLIGQIRADDTASYRSFTTPAELTELIESDLMVLLTERFENEETSPTRRSVRPPIPINEMLGRSEDLATVMDALMSGSRLVTITGPGGMGKSRLALEVARAMAKEVPDGTVFVPLEPIYEARQVPRAIADALGLRLEYSTVTLEAVMERLRSSRLLMLMDNFEHVLEAAPDVAKMVDASDELQVLVTSRRPLRVRGEREIPLGPLSYDASAELFVQRARAVRPGFAITEAEQAQLAELMKRLDHLPLAIELAAARMRLLDVPELLKRLEQRMEVLGSAPVNYPDRQRTLRTTIDWSHNLLTESEQTLLARLSVFSGGADLDAIEAVCLDVGIELLDVIDSLLENSLILRTAAGPSGQLRFAMLNTIKTYAADQLDLRPDLEEIRARHADWFLELAKRGDFSRTNSAIEAWPLLDQNLANLSVATRWCLDRDDIGRVAGFARPLWFWLWQSGRLKEAQPFFERALSLISPTTDDEMRAELMVTVGTVRFFTGDYQGAEKLLSEAMPIVEDLRNDALLMIALISQAVTQPYMGRMAEAADFAAMALEISRRSNIAGGIGYASVTLGLMKALEGDLAEGRALSEDAVVIGERIRLDGLRIQGWLNLAVIDVMEDHPQDAMNHLWLASEVVKYFEDREGAALALEVASTLATYRSDYLTAARAEASAEALRNAIGMPIWPVMDMLKQANAAQMRLQLGDEAYAAAVEEARLADPWEVLDDAVGVRHPSEAAEAIREASVITPM